MQAHPEKFRFCENPGTIPGNWGKICENLCKISENLGKNGAQHYLTSNMAPNVCRKTSENHYFGGHTKKRSAKCARQIFAQVWEIWAKIFCTPQNLLAPTPMGLRLHDRNATMTSRKWKGSYDSGRKYRCEW